ncbi:MAG TPA: hypothetical protein VGB56_12755 [Flavisolibacter sp.]
MKKVSLQFQSLLELVNFTILIGVVNYEVNRTAFQLTCEMSEGDLDRALESYRAQIISISETAPSAFKSSRN